MKDNQIKQEHSQQYLKRRRFLTVLPLIVFPFLVLLFWLLGGGSGRKVAVQVKNGLNTQLPDANLKNQSALDKLSFYAMADRDSVKRAEQMQMDPNYQPKPSANIASTGEPDETLSIKIARVQRKADQPDYVENPVMKPIADDRGEIDRLQMMVQSISQRKTDPEIEALNGTLDKLLEIQNPDRVKKEKLLDKKNRVFGVTAYGSNNERNYFGNASVGSRNEFLSDNEEQRDFIQVGTIMAVVHGEQKLLVGYSVKLRLLQDVFVNRERIPAGSFVFGYSSIDKERLKVAVNSIQFQNRLYPVALTVFDMDGLEGINIHGSVGGDVVRQSADQGIQSIDGLSFDPSLKAQAASVGLTAAKSLFSKKIKQERVTIKAAYKVLLREENIQTN